MTRTKTRTRNIFGSMLGSQLFVPALVTCLAIGPVFAAGGVQLINAVFKDEIVKTVDGKTEHHIVPAKRFAPGESVIYRLTLRNQTAQAIESPTISAAVPPQLEYIATSPTSPVPQVSVDAGHSFGVLQNLTVKQDTGGTRPARAADVTHMRWTLPAPLKAASEAQISYSARVK